MGERSEGMRALVVVRAPDGRRVELAPGDLIGRAASARLVVDDPSVSEAHAMLSLRHGELVLLSLRRLVSVRGRPVKSVALTPGLEVELARGVPLVVEAVEAPARVAALVAKGLGARPLGHVASVWGGARPEVRARFEADAPAHVWSAGARWRLRVGSEAPRDLDVGDAFEVDGAELRVIALEREAPAGASTSLDGAIAGPLRIVCLYDAVEVHRGGTSVLSVGGVGARILGELVAHGGSAEWHVIASEVWRDAPIELELRQRFDAALARLRAKLRGAGVRTDLVRADGTGGFHLALRDGDELVDRS